MIIVKLKGGLGNQMFQYAIGRHLSLLNNSKLILDLSFLKKKKNVDYTLRDYELNIFNISAQCKSSTIYFGNTVISKILTRMYNMKYVSESTPAYIPDILKLRGNIYLDGFWQTEKYFTSIKDTILKDLTYAYPFDAVNSQYAHWIKTTSSVSIHIRRGDYVSGNSTSSYHYLCTPKYYETAIKEIRRRINNPTFFIFSDDISWAQKNIALSSDHHFMVHNAGTNSHFDMLLMSLCKHNIIANSSFSWWAAWLNSNNQKVVICPEQWFNDKRISTLDIKPISWLSI